MNRREIRKDDSLRKYQSEYGKVYRREVLAVKRESSV